MNATSMSKFAKLAAGVCGSLALFVYLSLIAFYPFIYWLMDGGIVLGMWLLLGGFVLLGGWWVMWCQAPKFSWVWLMFFLALHTMLFLSPTLQGVYKQDACLDDGSRWVGNQCIVN
jgi:hypothetical protein